MARVLHRIEVVEITVELVEPVDRGKVFITVAQVVLAELAGGVAHRLQNRRNGHRLAGYADFRARLADGGHSGTNGKLTGDEVRTACRTARFGVVVGEDHAFSGHLV